MMMAVLEGTFGGSVGVILVGSGMIGRGEGLGVSSGVL